MPILHYPETEYTSPLSNDWCGVSHLLARRFIVNHCSDWDRIWTHNFPVPRRTIYLRANGLVSKTVTRVCYKGIANIRLWIKMDVYHWCFYKQWQENAHYFSYTAIYKWQIRTFFILNDLYSLIWYHNKEKQMLTLSWPQTEWASLFVLNGNIGSLFIFALINGHFGICISGKVIINTHRITGYLVILKLVLIHSGCFT